MNIQEMVKNGTNALFVVSGGDLKEFALTLIAEANASKNEPQQEEYLTSGEVCEILHVSSNTLWRWNRSGYLCSSKVGRSVLYKKTDIDNLRGGRP